MIIFVFAQMNAIPCIGEQDKRLDERITFETFWFAYLSSDLLPICKNKI